MCHICDTSAGQFSLSKKKADKIAQDTNASALVNDYINQLYKNGKVNSQTKKELHTTLYEPLKAAVQEGIGSVPKIKFEYGTPNYEMLKNLQVNTAVFSIFKSHALQKEVAAALKDENGNLRSKQQFKAAALAIDNKYRVSHLDTEYDTAVRASRMAAMWAKALTTAKLYPNLRYTASLAASQREEHKQFYGIVRSINDAFWNTHLPPNGWRCQCGYEPVDDEPTDLPSNLKPPDVGFAFNSGKSGKVFDLETCSYKDSIPKKDIPAMVRDAKKIVNQQGALDAPYQQLYKSKKTDSEVWAHPMSFDNADFKDCLNKARDLANSKIAPNTIDILPDLHDPVLRAKLLPDAKGTSNPDYRIDGKVYDLKIPSGTAPGSRTIDNLISDANSQGNGAVLIIPSGYTNDEHLYDEIGKKLRREPYKDFELYLHHNGDWQHFDQEQWLEFYKNLPTAKGIKKPRK